MCVCVCVRAYVFFLFFFFWEIIFSPIVLEIYWIYARMQIALQNI